MAQRFATSTAKEIDKLIIEDKDSETQKDPQNLQRVGEYFEIFLYGSAKKTARLTPCQA